MVQTTKLEEIKGFQMEKTKGVSPWMLSLKHELGAERPASSWIPGTDLSGPASYGNTIS
jgi:hypothetical protein